MPARNACGAKSVIDMRGSGQKKKIELLRRFLPFRDRTPSHDQIADIPAMLDAAEYQRRFVAWISIRPRAKSPLGTATF